MKVSKGIVWEVAEVDHYMLKRLLDDAWEPYAVVKNGDGSISHFLRRQRPV